MTRRVDPYADIPGRLYAPERYGPPCPRCGLPTVLSLVNATGEATHPSCSKETHTDR